MRIGHKTESICRRYAIVSESELREAVEKLGAVAGSLVPVRVAQPLGDFSRVTSIVSRDSSLQIDKVRLISRSCGTS
jgi:hypothetical protein